MKVQLFVTCLVDLAYPEIGERTVSLLERLGCSVAFPEGQTCCGQPAFNSGFRGPAERVRASWERAFEGLDGPIVAPFGSCARHVADPRVVDLPAFLVAHFADVGGHYAGRAMCHPECHLPDPEPTRRLLAAAIPDLVEGDPVCCGFGGTFSVKRPEISVSMADQRLDAAVAAGADAIVSTDPGCLMHLQGRARRRGLAVDVLHLVDVLEPDGRL